MYFHYIGYAFCWQLYIYQIVFSVHVHQPTEHNLKKKQFCILSFQNILSMAYTIKYTSDKLSCGFHAQEQTLSELLNNSVHMANQFIKTDIFCCTLFC